MSANVCRVRIKEIKTEVMDFVNSEIGEAALHDAIVPDMCRFDCKF